jgi:hypothetical protein
MTEPNKIDLAAVLATFDVPGSPRIVGRCNQNKIFLALPKVRRRRLDPPNRTRRDAQHRRPHGGDDNGPGNPLAPARRDTRRAAAPSRRPPWRAQTAGASWRRGQHDRQALTPGFVARCRRLGSPA